MSTKEKVKVTPTDEKKSGGIVKKLKTMGPAAIVTAAFIGPGTVTTASIAGANYGYALIWAMVFSVFATIILQEMAARLGIVTRKGLGEALREQFENPVAKMISIFLVVSAIGIGCAAYETGNILGGALGLQAVTGISMNIWGPLMGIGAFILLYTGSYKLVEKFLVGLVVAMSLIFITTGIIVRPDLSLIAQGLIPSVPEGSLLTVIALIGTTVVPYNLFLHASTVQERYAGITELSDMRKENAVGIILGGLISICVVITSAAAADGSLEEVNSAADMAQQLEPLLGSWAKTFMGIGLFAAGITSAVTAPLAAAYATRGLLGWKGNLKDGKFRGVWMLVLFTGVIFSAISYNPVQLIEFAQVANGITLPVIAIFLLYIMNKPLLLGSNRNSMRQNLFGILVILV